MSTNPKPQGEPTMKTIAPQHLTMKTALGMLLLTALALTGANAGILHSDPVTGLLPGGDFSLPNFPEPDAANWVYQDFPGQGEWSHNESGGSEHTRVTGTGAARHAEMEVGWYPRSASVWYSDTGNTGTTTAWSISADLMYNRGNNAVDKTFSLKAGNQLSADVFSMVFKNTSVLWTAGGQSGSFTSATGLDNVWRTAAFFFNPVTGLAYGKLGTEMVFSTTITPGLTVQTVFFSAGTDGGTWPDTAILSIDNVGVPEPAALGLLALGALGVLRRRSER